MTAVYEIRAFRNSDPPHLAELWRSQPAQRGMFQAVSTMLLEHHIFSKPYFDPNGLLVGTVDGVPVGFAHAGFGPNDERTHLCKEMGTTYMLLVRSEHRESDLPSQLLTASEEYLRKEGAKVLYAGGINPFNAFYLGLYGGSELPGVLTSDPMLDDVIRSNGYSEIDRVIVLQRSISSFRPEVSRKLRKLKREVTVEQQYCPPADNWWECCTLGDLERLRFDLYSRSTNESIAKVWYWNMEPLATTWQNTTGGIVDLFVEESHRRKGCASMLLSEVFKDLQIRGITQLEAQVMQSNAEALSFYEQMGFEQIDQGCVFRNDSAS